MPVISEKHESDSKIPKILCQMDNHLGCVNCVRWSLNGVMLASGGDDKIIMIWKKSKGSTSTFGGFTKNHENWRCVHTLRGHEGDVLDLAWSPGDRWLASSSVDNSVFVWDIQGGTAPTVMAILKGHTGLVKGVAWDPVGKFVASQSDDRSVKIWKTADWTCESTITEPFVECGGTTHILRLSWSPDGQYLVSAHAMNGGGPTAQIIDREGWKCDKDFVGHRKAVTCVRFHNSIMSRTAPKTSKTQQYCCLAVGSRDKSLSVWMTALQRPLVVIYDLFEESILDLSWSTDEYILMACSADGTVVFVQFSEQDIGTPLSEAEKNALYQRKYGKSMNDMNTSVDKDFLIENAELLNMSDSKKLLKPVPTFLSPEFILNSESITFPTIPQAEEKSLPPPASSSSPAKQAIHKQIETRTKDGKRRITPMFIPLTQDLENEPVFTGTKTEIQSSSRISSNIVIDKIQPRDVSPENKPNSDDLRMDSRLMKSSQDFAPAKTATSLSTTTVPMQQNKQNPTRSVLVSGNKVDGVTRIVGNYRVVVINNFLKLTSNHMHKVVCFLQDGKPISKQDINWQVVTGSAICNFNSCQSYILICCLDGTVRFVDLKTGILVMPMVNLPNQVVQSAFNLSGKELGGVVSECGVVRVWNIQTRKVELAVTCTDLLRVNSGNTTILLMAITDNGIPFIVLGNGTSYCYSRDLESWLVLNGKDFLQQRSLLEYSPTPNLNPNTIIQKDMKRYPLTSIQTTVLSMLQSSTVANISNSNLKEWEQISQLAFIENQIKLCEAIESPVELKYWYSSLGYHLGTCGTEQRLRWLLDDLLGPIYSSKAKLAERTVLVR